MNDEIRVKRPSEMCMLNMGLASHIDTTKQKERLSHSLSLHLTFEKGPG